jgi:outer membrane protein assembly factor BamB
MNRLILIYVWLLFIIQPCIAQDGTRWRGQEATGVYYETGLLETWPVNGPEILWHFDSLGLGFSSPVFTGEKICVTGIDDTTGYLYCLSIDGKLLWKKPYGPEWSGSYPGSRSSPTIKDGRMYIMSAKGRLVCMDLGDGTILWLKDLLEDFGGRNLPVGMTENLIVYDDKVICTPGGIKYNIIALNRYDGSLIWSSEAMRDSSAYCSPVLVKLSDRNLFITITGNNIVGLDADTGVLLWSYFYKNQYSVHANTPIYSNGYLYCFSGYGKGGVKLELNTDGSSVTTIWTNESMDSRIGGAVLADGMIFGSGDQNRAWQCIDWETGKMKYSSVEIGKGSVIYADGKLFCYSEQGDLAITKPLANEFKVLGKVKVRLGYGPHLAHPVINEGKLYIRHGSALIAYKIK